MERIAMKTPLVEMDGDEMARIMWRLVKERLILPYVDLKTEYYDLGLLNRNETKDEVTRLSAQAAKRLGVAVKCSTITPDKRRMEEYPQLTEMWRSPNGTIRSVLDGTVFRTPIVLSNITPAVSSWERPITVARHAYGDIYRAAELMTREPGECTLTFHGKSGSEKCISVQKVNGPAVWLGMHNLESSIKSFARACFIYAADTKQDLWFSTKDTIEKIYGGEFRGVFDETFEEFRGEFERDGISYRYMLIDDAASKALRSRGGFIWALRNYDGDVMSDLVASAFGSPAMMSSVLASPDGCFEYEAAHGTVTDMYYRYLKGEAPAANPTATVFAWGGALSRRGEKDGIPELSAFGERMKSAAVRTLEAGIVTCDISPLIPAGHRARTVGTEEFLRETAARMEW